MKVAMLFADDGSRLEDAVVGSFRSADFLECLRECGVDPVVISLRAAADGGAGRHPPSAPGVRSLDAQAHDLSALFADERPDLTQTFGPEWRLHAGWPAAAAVGPVAHCVSSWPAGVRRTAARSQPFAVFAAAKTKRASGHVAAIIGTSRTAIGAWFDGGYFGGAKFSAVVSPPVARARRPGRSGGPSDTPGGAAEMHTSPDTDLPPAGAVRTAPRFGIHAPAASAELVTFLSHAVELLGRPDAVDICLAVDEPAGIAATPGISIVAAPDVDAFAASIDVFAVPAWDDSAVAGLIASLRAGKAVILPDRGGGAELIGYGRHGLMFCDGSPYHFANALDLVSQSWKQKPVLLADGGPVIARTDPAAVAEAVHASWERALAAHQTSPPHGARVAAGGG